MFNSCCDCNCEKLENVNNLINLYKSKLNKLENARNKIILALQK